MQVWNVLQLHAARWKCRMQKIAIWEASHNFGYIFATKACIDNRKKNLWNSNISSACHHNMLNFGPITAEICWRVWGTPANFNGFLVLASLLQRVTERKSTKLCTIFGRLLGCYTIYIDHFCLVDWILPRAKFTASKSCVLLYWQRYCTALQQRAYKLCSVVQGMELRNFCRGRHLYSAGRPSRWHRLTFLVNLYRTN